MHHKRQGLLTGCLPGVMTSPAPKKLQFRRSFKSSAGKYNPLDWSKVNASTGLVETLKLFLGHGGNKIANKSFLFIFLWNCPNKRYKIIRDSAAVHSVCIAMTFAHVLCLNRVFLKLLYVCDSYALALQ